MVIDFFGLTIDDGQAVAFPEVYQRILNRVKPERDRQQRATIPGTTGGFSENREQPQSGMLVRPSAIHRNDRDIKASVFQFPRCVDSS